MCILNTNKNLGLELIFLTGSKWHVSKLLSSGGVVVEVAVRLELHPVLPGVVQTVVDGRGDADLVAHRDGVSCCRLYEARGETTVPQHCTVRFSHCIWLLITEAKN